MWAFALCVVSSIQVACARQLKTAHELSAIYTHSPSEPVRQTLNNHDDASYTAEVIVGGQKLQAILDSGSFELLIFGTQCWICGEAANLFDENKSSTFVHGPGLSREHSFGSGNMNSVAAADTVSFAGLSAPAADFWEVYDAAVPVLLQDTSFQAIAGVGPPLSALTLAEMELEHAKEAQEYAEGEGEVNKINRIIAHSDELVTYTNEKRSLLERFGVETYSICLNPTSGTSGTFIWADDAPVTKSEYFTTVPVVGDFYWSAKMSDVRLGAQPGSHHTKTKSLGCVGNASCSAVLDTGTSLIVAPWAAAAVIDEAVQAWGGDCSDLSKLPEFEFKLGGEQFSLPPSSYVGEICGQMDDWDDDLRRMMRHDKKVNKSNSTGPFGHKKSHKKPADDCQCVAMIMAEEMSSPQGQQWILGLPFFRKYYTSFQLGEQSSSSSTALEATISRRRRRKSINATAQRPVAKSFAFALADSHCNPTNESQLSRNAGGVHGSMHVAASGLRVPSWLKQVKAVTSGSVASI